ncbi:MAG: abortive infection family protein [Chloroflexota bacterium]|nr:abortive infection family protein [Chloroflexota bacterium]
MSPLPKQSLPLQVVKLASAMFAGDTGFSGPEITAFFSQYSNDIVDYWDWELKPSRWVIFESCLESFELAKQREILLDLCDYEGPMKHGAPSAEDLAKLRRLLVSITPAREVEQSLKKIDARAIRDSWRKMLRRVGTDPEGAITSARALIESTCKAILDELGIEYESGEKLGKLYKKVAAELNLSPDQHGEQIFKQILGGCFSVATGIAALRNAYSDAHGKPKRYIKPSARHARLAVNMAGALCAFLLDTYEVRSKTDLRHPSPTDGRGAGGEGDGLLI